MAGTSLALSLALGVAVVGLAAGAGVGAGAQAPAHRRAVVLIVVDGLRPDAVTADVMPRLHALGRRGMAFAAHHSVFPTVTRVNASSMATGAYPSRAKIFRPGKSRRHHSKARPMPHRLETATVPRASLSVPQTASFASGSSQ